MNPIAFGRATMVTAMMALPAANGAGNESGDVSRIWDMTKMRKVPFTAECFHRETAPFHKPGMNDDWVRTGDTWVGRTAAPEKGRKLRTMAHGKLAVEEYYLTCGTAPNRMDRVFCALAVPAGVPGPFPLALVFHGGGGHGSRYLALAIARRYPGLAALSMDYNGQFRPGTGPMTQWVSVTAAMRRPELSLVPDPTNTPMYHSVMAARRVLDFLEKDPRLNAKRVGCVGISYGGWVSLILAGVDPRVRFVYTMVSAGGMRGTSGRASRPLRFEPADQRELWRKVYDPESYAHRTKASVYFNICSNDRFFWLRGAVRNLAAFPGVKRMLVRPNADHNSGGPAWPNQVGPWLAFVLGDAPAFPEVADGSLRASTGSIECRVHSPFPIKQAVLCWSPGRDVADCARYWLVMPAEVTGERVRAQVPKSLRRIAAMVYFTVFDNQARGASSMPLYLAGIEPQNEPVALWGAGSWIDRKRGPRAWRPLGAGGGAPTDIRDAGDDAGVLLVPKGKTDTVEAITNSFVLPPAAAHAATGVRLVLDGRGLASKVKVALVRDIASLDEVRFEAETTVEKQRTVCDLPWQAFHPVRGAAGKPMFPVNGLYIKAVRKGGIPLGIVGGRGIGLPKR